MGELDHCRESLLCTCYVHFTLADLLNKSLPILNSLLPLLYLPLSKIHSITGYSCDWIKWTGKELAWVTTLTYCYLKQFIVAECCSVIFHEEWLCFVIEIKLDVNLYMSLGVVLGTPSCHSMNLSTSHYLIYRQQFCCGDGWNIVYLICADDSSLKTNCKVFLIFL